MPRLLLLEDDVMMGGSIRMALRQENFDVDWVQDRLGAERALQSARYAAIVLDIAFPRREHLNSIEWLRTRTGQVPIVVISSINRADALARIKQAVGAVPQGEGATVALPFSWG